MPITKETHLHVVIISRSGGYIYHSVHTDRLKAEQWAECKRHDSDDVSILDLDYCACEEFLDRLERIRDEK